MKHDTCERGRCGCASKQQAVRAEGSPAATRSAGASAPRASKLRIEVPADVARSTAQGSRERVALFTMNMLAASSIAAMSLDHNGIAVVCATCALMVGFIGLLTSEGT